MPDEDQTKILADIRDVLREQLPDLNRIAEESLGLQRVADEKVPRWLVCVVSLIAGMLSVSSFAAFTRSKAKNKTASVIE